jgi:hypothetical protein
LIARNQDRQGNAQNIDLEEHHEKTIRYNFSFITGVVVLIFFVRVFSKGTKRNADTVASPCSPESVRAATGAAVACGNDWRGCE